MALPLLAFAITPSAAKAVSFTGNYPVLETQVKAALQAPQQHGYAGDLQRSLVHRRVLRHRQQHLCELRIRLV
jgi:hypothetical protein